MAGRLIVLCCLLVTCVSCQSTQLREKKARLQKSTNSLKAVTALAQNPKTPRPKPQWGPEEKILAATLKAEEPAQALAEVKEVQQTYQVKNLQAVLIPRAESQNPRPQRSLQIPKPETARKTATVRVPSAVDEEAKNLEPRRIFLKGFASHRLTIQDLTQRQDFVFAQLDATLKRTTDIKFTTYLVRQGQSLQSVSRDLYHTTRRWPEIFLLNRNALRSWDNLKPGQELKVVSPEN